jgi:hypothetical protein
MNGTRRQRRAWAALAVAGALAIAFPTVLGGVGDLAARWRAHSALTPWFHDFDMYGWTGWQESYAYGYRVTDQVEEEDQPAEWVPGAVRAAHGIGEVCRTYSFESGGDRLLMHSERCADSSKPLGVTLLTHDWQAVWDGALQVDRAAWSAADSWHMSRSASDSVVAFDSGLVVDLSAGADLTEAVRAAGCGPAAPIGNGWAAQDPVDLWCAAPGVGREGKVKKVAVETPGDRRVTLRRMGADSLVDWTGGRPGGGAFGPLVLAAAPGKLFAFGTEAYRRKWTATPVGSQEGPKAAGSRDRWHGAGTAPPVVLDEDGNLYGLDPDNGDILWHSTYPVFGQAQLREAGASIAHVYRGDSSPWPAVDLLDARTAAVTDLGRAPNGALIPVTHLFDALTGALVLTSTDGTISGRAGAGATRLAPATRPLSAGAEPLDVGPCDENGYSEQLDLALFAEAGTARVQICHYEGQFDWTTPGKRDYSAAATDFARDANLNVKELAFLPDGVRLTMSGGGVWDLAKGCEVLRIFDSAAEADAARQAAEGLSAAQELAGADPASVMRTDRFWCPHVPPDGWSASPYPVERVEHPFEPGSDHVYAAFKAAAGN